MRCRRACCCCRMLTTHTLASLSAWGGAANHQSVPHTQLRLLCKDAPCQACLALDLAASCRNCSGRAAFMATLGIQAARSKSACFLLLLRQPTGAGHIPRLDGGSHRPLLTGVFTSRSCDLRLSRQETLGKIAGCLAEKFQFRGARDLACAVLMPRLFRDARAQVLHAVLCCAVL